MLRVQYWAGDFYLACGVWVRRKAATDRRYNMAEVETKDKATTQSDSAQATDVKKDSHPGENWEQKYKDQQAKMEQQAEELKTTKSTLDAVTPYVDWEAAQGSQQQLDATEHEFVSKKEVEQLRRQDREAFSGQMLQLQFRADYPDLREYENDIVGPAIFRFRAEFPRETSEQILKRAAEHTRHVIEKAQKAALDKADAKKAEEDAEKAAGLEAAGTTSPKEEERGQTDQEYLASREADIRKKKGI
jgi:hypothetical protein